MPVRFFLLVLLFTSFSLADVDVVRHQSMSERINIFKGLKKKPKPASDETLPTIPMNSELQKQVITKSYVTCETRNGQKFKEGDFGFDQCINEKRDDSRQQGLATPAPAAAPPSIENLRINLDHTFTF